MVQSDAQHSGDELTGAASPRFGHDFGRIAIRPSAAIALQTKLAVTKLGDSYEQEADRVSEQVMRMSDPHLPRACSCGGECPECQTKRLGQKPQSLQAKHVQASDTGQIAAPVSVEQVLASPGVPLQPLLRQEMEARIGHDFSQVRVHADGAAARSALDVNAHAYTVSNDIVFGTGKFAPGTSDGRRLLVHELTHVVQQSGSGGSPTLQRQPRGAAAGCGICMNDPGGRAAGNIAHAEVQSAFIAADPDIIAERPVPGIPNSGIDLSYERWRAGEHALVIGEIKPLDDAGQQADLGRRQLQDYAREVMLSGQYDEVYRMENTPPPGPLYFSNPLNPAGCPSQTIAVQLTESGLYQYYCEPPFSQLVRNPSCRCRPQDEDQRPPVPLQPDVETVDGETKGKIGEETGKNNGEPGKGDGIRDKGNGSRKPSRPGRQEPPRPQPSARDKGIDWGRVARNVGIAALVLLAIIGAIAALPAEILAGIVAGLVALLGFLGLAFAGGKKSGSTGGGSSGGKSSSKSRTSVPAVVTKNQTVPAVPSSALAQSSPRQAQSVTPQKQGPVPTKPPSVPAAASAKGNRISFIEGVNPERLAVGMIPLVWLSDEKKPDWKMLAALQVTGKSVDSGSKAATVEFKSLWETTSEGTRSLHSGLSGNAYFMRGPASPGVPGLVGYTINMPGNQGDNPVQARVHWLEILVAELQDAGRKEEADQVHGEIQRLQSAPANSQP